MTKRRLYPPNFLRRAGLSKRTTYALTAPAQRARVLATETHPACCDCGGRALISRKGKTPGYHIFPGPRCVVCACKAYAKRTGWQGDPAAVETIMVGDPNMRAILSRAH